MDGGSYAEVASTKFKESGSILTSPGWCDGSHTKHSIFQSQIAVLAQFSSTLPPEGIGESTIESCCNARHRPYSLTARTTLCLVSALISGVYKHKLNVHGGGGISPRFSACANSGNQAPFSSPSQAWESG